MRSIDEKEILKQAVTRLGGWLELSDDEIQAQPIFQHQMLGFPLDLWCLSVVMIF